MSNILSDFLPDAPREASILIAASDSDVAGQLRAYLTQGMNAGIAQGIVASVFAERTALTPDACQWVVHEIAVALGVPPQEGIPPGPAPSGRPAPSFRPTTVDRPDAQSPRTAPMPADPVTPIRDAPPASPGSPPQPQFPAPQPQYPGQSQLGAQPQFPAQPQPGGPQRFPQQPQFNARPQLGAQPQFGGQPQFDARPQFGGQPQVGGPPPFGGQPQYPTGPQGYPAGPGRLPILPYDQAFAPVRRRKTGRNVAIGVTLTAVVAGIVAVILIIVSNIPAGPSHTGVIGQVTNVPAKTLSDVGTGRSYSDAVHRITGRSPLTRGGKPEVLYIGAAFCPYCAANQWAIIVALSRFGTFTDLTNSHSATSGETYPNIATLTFDKASYSSKYLTFVSVESEGMNRQPLQNPTAQETRLWNKYTNGSWPFMDLGNRFWAESLFTPAILTGKTQKQIAAALSRPSSPIAQAVDGSANEVIAAICSVTGNQPASVCDTGTITSIERGQ